MSSENGLSSTSESPLVVARVESQARAHGHRPAVADSQRELTYRELDAHANQLAGWLRSRGIGRGDIVGLHLPRSYQLVIAALAVLKTGAAYLPIDPANPPVRTRAMLTEAATALVLCGTEHLRQLDGLRHADPEPAGGADPVEPVALDRLHLAGFGEQAPGVDIAPDDLAYVVYTSGSTGQPKGVMVTHGALAHLISAVGTGYGLDPTDRTGLVCSPGFDVSVSELWLPLAAGACIDVIDPEALLSAEATIRWIAQRRITVTVLPTPLAERALQAQWPTDLALHTLLTGGDRLHVRPAATLPFRLVNNYGPTENTVISTFGVVAPTPGEPATLPSIGSPVPGTTVELLDAELRPTDEGEIYLGGPQLARGYLARPDLTAERFVAHPRPRVPGERLYRTGDVGRRLPSGEIEFLGRTDDQIQLRGHRIELAEVTAALVEHPDITAAHATVHGHGETAELVAYLQPADLRRLPASSALRRHLAQHLPAYMIPAVFVTMEALPLGTNGKVDRAALPAPQRPGAASDHDYVAPRTPTEQVVAQTWQEVLGAAQVGATDSFFDLGGHSLLATRIMGRLNDHFGRDLPVGTLFHAVTVADLAAAFEAALDATDAPAGSGLPPVRPGSGELAGPLSLPQQQVWFIDRLAPGNAAYHAQATIRVSGPFDPDIFARALTMLTERHESLRTTYTERDGQPVAVVEPPAPYPLRRVDLSSDPSQLDQVLQEELARPFDLSRLPLQRWTTIRLAEHEHELVMVEHHLVHDGWSFAVLMRELEALYTALARGEPCPLPPPELQFRDYARWQQEFLDSPHLRRQLDYWREQLAGATTLSLPTDHPRPSVQRHRGHVLRLEVPAGLAAELNRRCRAEGVSGFMVMYAAFVALLHRYTGDTDICVASGFANRRRPETENLIGMLVNMVVLRSEVTGATPFRDLLGQARQRVLAAAEHQECPFPHVVQALGGRRDLSRNPLAQVMFSAHDSAVRHPQFGAATGTVFERSNDTAKVDLNVVVVPRSHRELGHREHTDQRVTLLWEYDRDLFDQSTMQAMAQAYLRLLSAAVAAPDTPVGRLPMLDDHGLRTALVDWNPGVADVVPRSVPPVAEQVTEWARRTPEALAIADGTRELTYRELSERSTSLAGRLLTAGIGPDSVVAVCLPRGVELVTAELAVLHTGAAFLPIDPANPDHRIRAMLAGGAAALVLTTADQRHRVAAAGLPVLCADHHGAPPVHPAPAPPGPDQLAYVMFTSGSTGAPKGVMVTQHSFANLVAWHRDRLRLRAGDRTTVVATPGFDFSVWECWPPLTAGASLHLPPAGTLLSPPELRRWLHERRITVASLPTPLAASLLDHPWPDPGPLRTLVAGGDRLAVRPAAGLGLEVVNVYGPTENTVVSTGGTVAPAGAVEGLPDIGTPISGTTAYILDAELNPLPPGVVGELFLGGAGVARGYLGRSDLTADRFVPDPFGAPGARLYRTGDLARHRPDGTIDFVGRADDQVKLRGHRLEPAEVTAALQEHPAVREACVTVRTDRDEPALVAYVVAADPAPAADELRGFLAQRLPAPMLPSAYVLIDQLPLTHNGKVDRRALPAPVRDGTAGPAPAGDLERQIARVWAEVLGLDRVGVTDSFFDLGGHSLLLGQVQRRLECDLGRSVPLVTLFAHPSVRALAGHLSRDSGPGPAADEGQQQGQRQRGGRDRLRQRRGGRVSTE